MLGSEFLLYHRDSKKKDTFEDSAYLAETLNLRPKAFIGKAMAAGGGYVWICVELKASGLAIALC